jgi:hypothetical protein
MTHPLTPTWEPRIVLQMLVASDDAAQPRGIMDRVDNDGKPYQSAHMAKLVEHARALVSAPTTIGERQAIAGPREIYVRWSDDGQHIRKWDFKPFDGGACFLATPTTNAPVAETCEVCEHPDLCLNGRTICDLSSEFVAPVPAEIANKLLDETRRYGKPAGSLADAVERLGQIKDFFTTAGHAEWLADLQTVLRSTLPIHGEMREALEAALSKGAIAVLTDGRFDSKGWEPGNPNSPVIAELIEQGLFKRTDARCGFELLKDAWIKPTVAGRLARNALQGDCL